MEKKQKKQITLRIHATDVASGHLGEQESFVLLDGKDNTELKTQLFIKTKSGDEIIIQAAARLGTAPGE